MNPAGLRVLWVCGAAGAGKSVAAWGLFADLAASGKRVAYVDIDQLGMLHPAANDDPGWHHTLKSDALAALVPGYVAAGARLLIVSGVVDPHEGPGAHLLASTDLTLCLLSPDIAALQARILARGWRQSDADEAVAEHVLLQAAPFIDVRVDTSALSVAQTVAQLRDLVHLTNFAEDDRDKRSVNFVSPSGVGVVLLTGPRAVGSSTVGFGLARGRWRAGRRVGFLDLQQLGFVAHDGRTDSESALAIGQLAAMHTLMTERGAALIVVSGHLSVPDRALVRAALPHATTTVVRLRADERTLVEHVRDRAAGSDARLAADDLLGAEQRVRDRAAGSDARLAADDLLGAEQRHRDAVVAAALAEQRLLDTSAADDAVLDVSGRTPADVVAEVERLLNA